MLSHMQAHNASSVKNGIAWTALTRHMTSLSITFSLCRYGVLRNMKEFGYFVNGLFMEINVISPHTKSWPKAH